MGVGQTMMQMGAHDRILTNAVNLSSGAGSSRSDTTGVNQDHQFGSSQSEQSWKQWKSVEDAGVVVGLVPGDCLGDNSDDSYRKQMNQNRNGFMAENLVSQAGCEVDHEPVRQVKSRKVSKLTRGKKPIEQVLSVFFILTPAPQKKESFA